MLIPYRFRDYRTMICPTFQYPESECSEKTAMIQFVGFGGSCLFQGVHFLRFLCCTGWLAGCCCCTSSAAQESTTSLTDLGTGGCSCCMCQKYDPVEDAFDETFYDAITIVSVTLSIRCRVDFFFLVCKGMASVCQREWNFMGGKSSSLFEGQL